MGKWIIAGITAVSVVMGSAFAFLKPPEFSATTEIRSITSVQAERYRASNALGFFTTQPDRLRQLFIEQLQEGDVLVRALERSGLLSRAQFQSEEDYSAALIELAATIQILAPEAGDDAERLHWQLAFNGTDEAAWLQALADIRQFANVRVQKALSEQFRNQVSVAEQARSFSLEDLDLAITAAEADFEIEMRELDQKQGFDLEDVEVRISNALADYERTTQDRLAFLREQAAIARELAVAKNTLDANTFAANSGFVVNVETDTPFYLRGYEAIEKEMQLIESRKSKRPFVIGLFELEREKRALEQDQTLERAGLNRQFLDQTLDLMRQKRAKEQDQTLVRARQLFQTTPLVSSDEFTAVQMNVLGSDIQTRSKRALVVALSGVLGLMVAVLFVLVRSGYRNYQSRKVALG